MSAPSLSRHVFKTSRLAEFCSKKELVNQTGHAVEDWPLGLREHLKTRARHEADQAELAALRAKAAEAERRAQELAQAEIARREAKHRMEMEAADQARKAAENNAAEITARLRAESEAARAAEEDRAARELDTAHKAKVNTATKKAFIAGGLSEKDAKLAVGLIARGLIPAVRIEY